MRRFLASALLLGLLSVSTMSLVGCGQEAGTKTEQTTTGPEGSKTTTQETKTTTEGNPPATPPK